ncbi:PucR family transcriptional regulator [Solicola gregarius]|uniref:PucR family transcriptional regulator n=1 Tax=Solicola gregarius TaxID=2908642 RepID=A0AA46THN7_9ACTN|nr:PucR family transcriptional regulator [Solicola gregarius]UYM05544.1 PucR family transcriptional regulator [Solicola gregarius]
MRLRELLDAPQLALRMLVGDDASLDRPVRWTYSSDLMDPGRYLSGGELVITGLVWRRTPADSETFVANVARAGALAIAAGTAQFGEVPQDVVEACRRHGVALLAVPEQVSFSSLSEYVIGAAAAERGARLEARLGRNRELLSALARGERLDELLARVGADVGARLRVLTASGRAVGTRSEPLPDAVVAAVVAGYLAAESLPVAIGPAYVVHPVGGAYGSRLTSWMLVADVDADADRDVVDDALVELSTIVQVERTRVEERRAAARPLADEAVRMVATGAADRAETSVRLEQAGLDLGAPAYVVVVLGLEPVGDAAEARLIAEDVFDAIDGTVVGQTPAGETVVVVPAGDQERVGTIRSTLTRLAPGLTARRLAAGISDAAALAGLSGMLEESQHAFRLALTGDDPVSIVSGREVDSHVLLLATVPDEVRRLFAQRVLGSVLAYDAEHDGGLLATLEAFLDCSGSWSRTADRLHLHVNTVRYRMARVESLTGRDLSRLPDRVDVFLALRSLRS